MLCLRRGRGWVCGILLGAFAAGPGAHADALSAVQLLREGGCGGIVPAARRLRPNALLDRAAAQWAAGSSLLSAAQRSGYPAKSTAGWHVMGPDRSLVQLLRRSDCRKIANPALRDVGIYRRGEDSWVVLASGYARPMGSPLALSSPAPLGSPASLGSSVSVSPRTPLASSASALAMRALQLVNDVRAQGTRCGSRFFGPAPPLTLSATLAGVALGHATDMAEHDYFEHVDLAGRSPADRVRAVGYREKLVGENIAYGPETVDEVVQGWLHSPGHCANIMDPRFVEMGLAYAAGGGYGSGYTDRPGPYWVQLFAEPRD